MRVYLVRHGKAEKGSPSGRDEDRPLQTRGERQSLWLAQAIGQGAASHRPRLILTSPAARARRTAELIGVELACPVRVLAALALGHPAAEALREIQQAATEVRSAAGDASGPAGLMVVGHNPQLEILIPMIVPQLPSDEAELRTGQAFVVDVAGPAGLAGSGHAVTKLRSDD